MEKLKLTEQQRKELKALVKMPDEDIDYSDIPQMTNWDNAVRGKFYRLEKKIVKINLDGESQ